MLSFRSKNNSMDKSHGFFLCAISSYVILSSYVIPCSCEYVTWISVVFYSLHMLIWMYLFPITSFSISCFNLLRRNFWRIFFFKRSILLGFILIPRVISAARIISEVFTETSNACHLTFYYLVGQWLLSSDHEIDHILSEALLTCSILSCTLLSPKHLICSRLLAPLFRDLCIDKTEFNSKREMLQCSS